MKVIYGKSKPITIEGEDLYGILLTLIRDNLSYGFTWRNCTDEEKNARVREDYYKLLNEKELSYTLVCDNFDKRVYFKILEE